MCAVYTVTVVVSQSEYVSAIPMAMGTVSGSKELIDGGMKYGTSRNPFRNF